MGKNPQIVLGGVFVIVLLIFYFGFNTNPKNHKLIEKSRAVNQESTDIRLLIQSAKATVDPGLLAPISIYERELSETTSDSVKTIIFEKLAGEWYTLGYPSISGYYAEAIAQITNSDEAWSIAGTTFAYGMRKAATEEEKNYCRKHALDALEKAISLNTKSVEHKINHAILYVEAPDAENPMQGIQMLLKLNETYPESVPVLNQLGRLSIQTKQWEKAEARLTKAEALDPENRTTACLLAELYDNINNKQKMAYYMAKCKIN